jgi:hypothetical protein
LIIRRWFVVCRSKQMNGLVDREMNNKNGIDFMLSNVY